MLPAVTAAFPFLFDLFDGRQSARTIHFIVARSACCFFVLDSRPCRLSCSARSIWMRSMISGALLRDWAPEKDVMSITSLAPRDFAVPGRSRDDLAAGGPPLLAGMRPLLFPQPVSPASARFRSASCRFALQRLECWPNQPLVREFTLADISLAFRPNGTGMPAGIGLFPNSWRRNSQIGGSRSTGWCAGNCRSRLTEIKAIAVAHADDRAFLR